MYQKLEIQFAGLLKSNSFHLGNYPGKVPGSRREMNQDVGAGSNYTERREDTQGKNVTWNTRAPEAVAAVASNEYSNTVKKKVEKK